MPVLGWAFVGAFVEIAAVLVLFLLAVPTSAVFLPILSGVSAIGFYGQTAQTMSVAVAIALAIVTAGVLIFLINRLEASDSRRAVLTNALVFVVGIPACMGAAYYRAKGMF